VRDPESYERFENVYVVHGCRLAAELAYATKTTVEVRDHEFLAEFAAGKLEYYATLTREPYHHQGRITDLIRSGHLFDDLDTYGLDVASDRVMICGSPDMTFDLRQLLVSRGFAEGNMTTPGNS